MNENPIIVPIQLRQAQAQERSTETQGVSIACELKLNDAEITFYNGIDKHILHAVLGEVNRNAR